MVRPKFRELSDFRENIALVLQEYTAASDWWIWISMM